MYATEEKRTEFEMFISRRPIFARFKVNTKYSSEADILHAHTNLNKMHRKYEHN